MTTAAPTRCDFALAIHIRGLVQGVGFRPFVHRLAMTHGVTGWVRNDASGVFVLAQGSRAVVNRFVRALERQAPRNARIEALDLEQVQSEEARGFEIVESTDRADRRQAVTPDVALCARCERELFDPSSRRFGYPFVTCTDCGPRFSVIDAMPYDRERTTMRRFAQCPDCLAEYHTATDRRYHCESNSCPDCGPRVWFEAVSHGERLLEGGTGIQAAAQLLLRGGILAVRGLGGFHLAVDATDDTAVRRLRANKEREAKPLAVMVATLDEARRLGMVGPEEERLLRSAERPIVLLDAVPGSPLAPSIALGLNTVGVMTAYTPIHQLLLQRVGRPLAMTSGNLSDEPIVAANDEARSRLKGVAQGFLLHDREIATRCDDSVVRVVDGNPLLLRRARGYAPLPLGLPIPAPLPLVAVGPHLKNTFTLAADNEAYVSQHIGDLENFVALEHFRATLDTYERLFRIRPRASVRDMHPGYLSSRVAAELGLEQTLAVQHHHAHIAAIAAEHGVTERIIGVAYDGAGYGEDGAIWGAEILVADLVAYERWAHLRYAPMPGGDLAARQPWRAAIGYSWLDPYESGRCEGAFPEVSEEELTIVRQQLTNDVNAPHTSSMGRLFDAAAASLGVRSVACYEGQAAMELEALAGTRAAAALPFPVRDRSGRPWILDPVPLLAALRERLLAGDDVAVLAARFHESVARVTGTIVSRVRESTGIATVALGGGVFQNRRLLSTTRAQLRDRGFRVLIPHKLSPNDGAISYGQAAVGAARLEGPR